MTTTLNASTAGAGGFIATSDNSGSLALQTAGTTAVTIDTSQNATFSGSAYVNNAKEVRVYNSANTRYGSLFTDANGTNLTSFTTSGEPLFLNSPTGYMTMSTNGSERMRIDSSGNLLVNVTSISNSGKMKLAYAGATQNGFIIESNYSPTSGAMYFNNPNGTVGTIVTSASSTAYNTSSDYRLKESIAPMTGALAKVALLKPVTYKWKVDGSNGEGFIAHELAEVVEGCVTGEKDAVDADGNPKYQGIDTSFLVATLTAAIQELKAINDTQAETINAQSATLVALTARIVAIESRGTV